MPVQIGAKAHNFTDPTGLLSDCHRRVEMFLGILASVADQLDQPATDERKSALRTALRYFREAAPKHTADEEVSLFPRLRKIDHPDIRTRFTQLDKLEADHRWAEPLHGEVDRLGIQYLETGELSNTEVRTFRDSIASLVSMYKEHIRVEDELIFPLAVRFLSSKERSDIGNEMTERRQVKLVTELG